MSNVHPIFEPILDSIEKLPTNLGPKTIPEIMDHLMWSSYAANRGYGVPHERLVKWGIGNEEMKVRYEKLNTTNPQNQPA